MYTHTGVTNNIKDLFHVAVLIILPLKISCVVISFTCEKCLIILNTVQNMTDFKVSFYSLRHQMEPFKIS